MFDNLNGLLYSLNNTYKGGKTMKQFLKTLKVSAMILGSVCLIAPSSAFASELDSNTEVTQVAPQSDLVPHISPISGGKEITPNEPIVTYTYRKSNVSTYNIWSPYQRVSESMGGGLLGAEITATKSLTYNVEVNGSISGLGYSLGKAITTQLGYSGKVPPNKVGYMGHKMYYKVETGTRQKIHGISGRVVEENYYTIRTPQYGQFDILY